MKCPKCSLENLPSAMWCDCGYNFETTVLVPKIKSEKEIKKISLEIKITSTLSLLWGLLTVAGTLALGIPALAQGKLLLLPLLLLLIGSMFLIAGVGIRQKRQYGAWISVILVPMNAFFLIYSRFPLMIYGLAVGLFILFGVLRNWKSFEGNHWKVVHDGDPRWTKKNTNWNTQRGRFKGNTG